MSMSAVSGVSNPIAALSAYQASTSVSGSMDVESTSSPPPSSSSVLSLLTPSDRSMIAAATGIVITPNGSITGASGNPPSGVSSLMNEFVFVIAAARQIGAVQGRITPQDLEGLFPPYISQGLTSTTKSALANAATYLSSSTSASTSPSGGHLDVSA